MKKIVLLILLINITLVFYHCSSTKTIANAPSNVELEIAKKRWPDATIASLTEGHTIYTTRCNRCHGLKTISKYNEAKWDHEINDMAPKAKLTVAETETLRRYILSVREAAAVKAQ